MNKIMQKVISLLLVILITILSFYHYKIITFSSNLNKVFIFSTFVLIIISSISVISNSKSGFMKFINYIILITAIIGGVLVVVDSQLNIFIYVCLLFTIIYSLTDMLYKKA